MRFKFKPTPFHERIKGTKLAEIKTYFFSKELIKILEDTSFEDTGILVDEFYGYVHIGLEFIGGMIIRRPEGFIYGEQIEVALVDPLGRQSYGKYFVLGTNEEEQQQLISFANKLVVYIQYRKLLLNTKPPKYMLQRKPRGEYIDNAVYIHDAELVRHLNSEKWLVRPHFRLQRCGPAFSEKKLVLVKEHTKGHRVLCTTPDPK